MKATDIRRGHIVIIDGQPCRVMDFQHRTPGNLRAFVQLRLRNLASGNTFDQRVSATDFLDEGRLETRECQVLYRDDSGVHVMDVHSFEQFMLDAEAVGDHSQRAGNQTEGDLHDGDEQVGNQYGPQHTPHGFVVLVICHFRSLV